MKNWYNFFLYTKIVNNYDHERKKASKRITWKYQNIKSTYQNLSEEEKEKWWKETRHKYQNLSEEEKEKKHQYHHKGNKHLSEEQKQKQVEYIRNYYSTN